MAGGEGAERSRRSEATRTREVPSPPDRTRFKPRFPWSDFTPAEGHAHPAYSYWANDNIYQRTDANNPTYSETYTYDDMDRLTSSVSAGGTQSFTYDSINNILTKDGLTYAYGSSRPHAVTSTGTYSYSYDPNGNMTGRTGGRTLTYDDENRVASMADGAVTSSYVYDAQRQRTIKTEGTKTTYYFFPDFEQEYTSGAISNTLKCGFQAMSVQDSAGCRSMVPRHVGPKNEAG